MNTSKNYKMIIWPKIKNKQMFWKNHANKVMKKDFILQEDMLNGQCKILIN